MNKARKLYLTIAFTIGFFISATIVVACGNDDDTGISLERGKTYTCSEVPQ